MIYRLAKTYQEKLLLAVSQLSLDAEIAGLILIAIVLVIVALTPHSADTTVLITTGGSLNLPK